MRAANSRTGLEYVADLREVFASAAYTQAEIAACVCAPRTIKVKNDQNFFSKVIRGGKLCVYSYNPETKQQSSQ
jgi:hypothetical protein